MEGFKCKVEGVTLPNNVDAVLDQIEAQQAIELKSKSTPLEFLQAVYSNEGLPLSARLKAAIEAAQYVHPKLAVTATVNASDFADQLEKAVERSRKSFTNDRRFKRQRFKRSKRRQATGHEWWEANG